MTTVAVGFGGLAAGAAVLGAIGLGLGALALGGRRRGGNSRRRGRGRGRGRGRRQAEEEADNLENFLQVIRYEDVTGCGLRLACELSAKEEDQLSIEELAIVDLLNPLTEPGQELLPTSASADYKAAITAGNKGQNCAKEFQVCPYNSSTLMNTVMNYLP